MRQRVLGSLASLLLLALTVSVAGPAQADWEGERRCRAEASVNSRQKAINVRKECETTPQPASSSGDDSNSTANKASNYNTSNPVYSRHVSGCYPDQLQNLDFGDCQRQQDIFCGDDGTWVQQVRVRRENPDEPIEHGSRFCAADAAGGGSEGRPAITMDDLAAVAPNEVDILLQNGGRGMRNAHTNIYADAEQILERKTQFGELTLMRLTPVEFRWDYGDGTTRTTTDPGRDAVDFNTETSTSHVYEDTGTYTVTLTTVFIGEVSYDDGETWELVPGQLVIDSTPAQADIFRSVTRNVAEDCVANPSGWGCGAPGSAPTD